MNNFQYKNQELYCENVDIKEIVKEVGTPFYLYSYGTILRHFHVFKSAFVDLPHIVCYAMKANSNIAVVKTLIKAGSGLDIVSGGELYRALRAGASPKKIVYAGVGKTGEEIRYALENDILMFNVESSQELTAINQEAARMGKKAGVALRINPDIDAKTHPYISTGLKGNKFGISIDSALIDYKRASSMKNIEILGVQAHIGSQITKTGPFVDSLKRILLFTKNLKKEGISIKYLNLGGGLGITYDKETPPHPEELAEKIMPLLKDTGFTVIFEPGRVILGNAGILVSRVLYTKESEGKRFVIIDGGMNDLARPSLYSSYHEILPMQNKNKTKEVISDVVGPICESGDFIAKDRLLPEFKKDDLIAIMSAGAYGFTMSSNYNSRLKVAEVMVNEDKYHTIKDREQYQDIVRGESVPQWLTA